VTFRVHVDRRNAKRTTEANCLEFAISATEVSGE